MISKNQFLVSLPVIGSGSFHKSVVYLTEHNGNGSRGWIINKKLDDATAARLRKGMKININVPVFYGGPVDVNNAYILHTKDFHIPTTVSLNNELSVTRDKAVIDILNMGQYPEHWKIIVGSSNWGPGQLESEILGSRSNGVGSWVQADFSSDLFWKTMHTDQWTRAIELSAEKLSKEIFKEYQ
jgi:putative transcriptional regulator